MKSLRYATLQYNNLEALSFFDDLNKLPGLHQWAKVPVSSQAFRGLEWPLWVVRRRYSAHVSISYSPRARAEVVWQFRLLYCRKSRALNSVLVGLLWFFFDRDDLVMLIKLIHAITLWVADVIRGSHRLQDYCFLSSDPSRHHKNVVAGIRATLSGQ
jgi:hypothetical protein